MAGTDKTTPEAPQKEVRQPVEVEVSREDTTTRLNIEDRGAAVPKAEHLEDDTATFEAGKNDAATEEEDGDAPVEGDQPDDGGAEDQPDGDAPEPLPDYDPANEEVRSQYDARYFKEGELNLEVLSKEYWADFGKNEGDISKSGLPESTYAYLKDTIGLTKDAVKQIEKALVTDHAASQSKDIEAVLSRVDGGAPRYGEAIEWAKGGGYTKEQRDRFNALLSKGGADRDDAVDALMARFEKAAGPARRGVPGGRKPSSPARNATAGAAAGASPAGAEVFKTRAEYTTAWRAGIERDKKAQEGSDRAEKIKAREHIEFLRRKARRSKFPD